MCGVATLIQTLGLWIFGIRLPVIMGCTFAAVGPMVAIGLRIRASAFSTSSARRSRRVGSSASCSRRHGKLLPPLSPVVVGTVIAVIGLSLMGVGINWAAGGVGNPDYGNPAGSAACRSVVLMLILLINKFARGFIA